MAVIAVNYSESGNVDLSGATSVNVTLGQTVDPSRCLVIFGVSGQASSQSSSYGVAHSLTSTTLTFARSLSNADVAVDYSIIEFDSSVDVQRISGITTAGSYTVTISTVDLSRSIVLIDNQISVNTSSAQFATAEITDTTTVSVVSSGSGATRTIQVVQLPGSAIQSLQVESVSQDLSSGHSISISSVDTSKSLIIGSGYIGGNLSGNDYVSGYTFASATSVDLGPTTGTTGTQSHVIHVLEFTDYDVIHGNASTSNLSVTETLADTPSDGALFLNTGYRPSFFYENYGSRQLKSLAWTASRSSDAWTLSTNASNGSSVVSYSAIDWGQTAASSLIEVSDTISDSSSSANSPLIPVILSPGSENSNADANSETIYTAVSVTANDTVSDSSSNANTESIPVIVSSGLDSSNSQASTEDVQIGSFVTVNGQVSDSSSLSNAARIPVIASSSTADTSSAANSEAIFLATPVSVSDSVSDAQASAVSPEITIAAAVSIDGQVTGSAAEANSDLIREIAAEAVINSESIATSPEITLGAVVSVSDAAINADSQANNPSLPVVVSPDATDSQASANQEQVSSSVSVSVSDTVTNTDSGTSSPELPLVVSPATAVSAADSFRQHVREVILSQIAATQSQAVDDSVTFGGYEVSASLPASESEANTDHILFKYVDYQIVMQTSVNLTIITEVQDG